MKTLILLTNAHYITQKSWLQYLSWKRRDGFLYNSELNKKQVISYGDIPAIAYIFDMELAIFTTWADLDSNRLSLLAQDLDTLYQNGKTPVVILGKEALDIRAQQGKTDQKLDAINAFMEASGYEMLYENGMFEVYGLDA